MKFYLSLFLFAIFQSISAQYTPPSSSINSFGKSKSSTQKNLDIKKEVLVKKEVFEMGKFEELNIQKIVSTDVSTGTTQKELGLMTLYETYDRIAQRTLTLNKEELQDLIKNLDLMLKEEIKTPKVDTKYKYTTKNKIEFGCTFHPERPEWSNYIKLPSGVFGLRLYTFPPKKMSTFIDLLKKTEKEL